MKFKPLKDRFTFDGYYYVATKEDIKSVIEFYKRYVYNEPLLADEEKDIYDIWYNYIKKQEKEELWLETDREIEYNDWLFDYIFGDK